MARVSLRIQAVLYNENIAAVAKSASSVKAALDHWGPHGAEVPRIRLQYGDAAPTRLADDDVAVLQQAAGPGVEVGYRHFGENTGFGKGHNLLAQDADDDYLLIINPDIVFAPHCIERLLRTAEGDQGIGMVEARQTPIENARWFDLETGDTDWACGACALVRRTAFQLAGGFDHGTFFMYCEDVDLSWAVRHAGFRVVCQPAAVAFHPHRLAPSGQWEPSPTERYHDALGKLLLARKWGEPEVERRLLAAFTWDDDSQRRRAAHAFRALGREGKLPPPVAGGRAAATFRGVDHTAYRQIDWRGGDGS